MIRLEELEQAVRQLPERDYSRFREWFLELDWQRWDQQIEADAAAGKLEVLIREAQQAKAAGQLSDL